MIVAASWEILADGIGNMLILLFDILLLHLQLQLFERSNLLFHLPNGIGYLIEHREIHGFKIRHFRLLLVKLRAPCSYYIFKL